MSEVDPIVELIDNEMGALAILNAFRMAAIIHPTSDKAQHNKNVEARSYNEHFKTMFGKHGIEWLKEEHTGKVFRKEVHEWALVLRKDARMMLLCRDWKPSTVGKRRAYQDVADAIINSFKKLKTL